MFLHRGWGRLFAISLLLFGSVQATATTQILDEIVLDGQPLPLLNDPIAALYPGLKIMTLMNMLPKATCSANWRGYKAYWMVQEAQLFLVRVVSDACSSSPKDFPIEKVAPGKSAPLLASWYSGTLILGAGGRVRTFGLVPKFDRYVSLRVKEGAIVERLEDEPKPGNAPE